MTRYQRDRLKIWSVVVRDNPGDEWCATSLRWFHTRKQCQEYIDSFRNEFPSIYERMEHRPMMFLPAQPPAGKQ